MNRRCAPSHHPHGSIPNGEVSLLQTTYTGSTSPATQLSVEILGGERESTKHPLLGICLVTPVFGPVNHLCVLMVTRISLATDQAEIHSLFTTDYRFPFV